MVAGTNRGGRRVGVDVVSIGIPAPIRNGRPIFEPRHLGTAWMDFDYEDAFGKPTKVVNDAAMQEVGSYRGGRMLFSVSGRGSGRR